MYDWVVFIHVLGGFGFVAAHGVSAHVAFQLRAERDRARIGALLELSSHSLFLLYGSLLVLLAAGILAGFMGGHWSRLWIWVALGLLVAIIVSMYVMASPYYAGVRRGLGLKAYGDAKTPAEPVTDDELVRLLASSRPWWIAAIGTVGLLIIIWLMLFKPF
jgi:hypothetical protein